MTGAGRERRWAFFGSVIINVGSVRYIYNKVKKYPQMKILRLIMALMLPVAAHAQYAWQDGAEAGRLDLSRDASWQVEMQGG